MFNRDWKLSVASLVLIGTFGALFGVLSLLGYLGISYADRPGTPLVELPCGAAVSVVSHTAWNKASTQVDLGNTVIGETEGPTIWIGENECVVGVAWTCLGIRVYSDLEGELKTLAYYRCQPGDSLYLRYNRDEFTIIFKVTVPKGNFAG